MVRPPILAHELERGTPALPPSFEELARTRAPEPRAAQLSLCTPEKLVSPDVLTVLSQYHTAFPAVSCTHYRTSFWRYSPGTALLFQQYLVLTSSFAAEAPRSSRSGAKPSRNSPRRVTESEVTIDCYSEKRSSPSQWSGSAPTGTRAWGASGDSTRQKPLALTQSKPCRWTA